MGMYTELVLKCNIENNSNAPEDVKGILNFLFNKGDTPKLIPDHPLFKCERWELIGKSFSSGCLSTSIYTEDGYIFSRSDFKNYDDEIELFIEWIKPYLEQYEGECIGWTWYDEQDKPDLIII